MTLVSLVLTLRTLVRSRAAVQLEILALRHSRVWCQWRGAVVIVKPETIIAWHRQGFRLWWRWKADTVVAD